MCLNMIEFIVSIWKKMTTRKIMKEFIPVASFLREQKQTQLFTLLEKNPMSFIHSFMVCCLFRGT